jgi:hypothetical protein
MLASGAISVNGYVEGSKNDSTSKFCDLMRPTKPAFKHERQLWAAAGQGWTITCSRSDAARPRARQ